MSHLYPFTAPADRPLIMLIDLTQQATRCSDSSGQAQEYLIARHAAVETETVLVQIYLELGAPSVICSLKECFQITDCLVYPMQIICFVFLCVQFHSFQIQVALAGLPTGTHPGERVSRPGGLLVRLLPG